MLPRLPAAEALTGRLHLILPAAGVGKRMGADRPKQYLTLLGRTILEQTLARFACLLPSVPPLLVLAPDDPWWPAIAARLAAVPHCCHGGAERSDSVRMALAALSDRARADDWVLVHDIARPCLRASDLNALLAALPSSPHGALLASPVADTLKRADAGQHVAGTVDRSRLWRALTPQVFPYGLLQKALARAEAVTDESSAVEALGLAPRLVEGHADNLKITTAADLGPAAAVLQSIFTAENPS